MGFGYGYSTNLYLPQGYGKRLLMEKIAENYVRGKVAKGRTRIKRKDGSPAEI